MVSFTNHSYPAELAAQVDAALAGIERVIGARLGDPDNPLLVSVRSGGRASMPGMMDTVLNLGLNDASVAGLARTSRDERFAYDSYRRFLQMYGQVVLGIEYDHFEAPVHFIKPLARLSAREIYISPTFRNPGRIDMELILTFTRNSANW